MKDLQELSKGKLHAYRDEARLTDLPDKLRPDHLSDDRTDAEKNRRRKGIQNATDKLQKIHKDSANAAKAARKDKPPKPKKPDSRMTLRKAAKLGSLWTEGLNMSENIKIRTEGEKFSVITPKTWHGVPDPKPIKGMSERERERTKKAFAVELPLKKTTKEELNMTLDEMKYGATHEFRGLTEFMDKCAEGIFKKNHIQVHSVETLPDEKSTIYHVSGAAESLTKASEAFWNEALSKSDSRPVAVKPSKFSGMDKKYMQEETDLETDAEETAVDSRDMFSAILDEDEQTNDIFDSLMGSRVDAVLDAMKQDMAAGMFAEPESEEEEVAVAAEDFIAALEEVGVELTEEQIDELSRDTLGSYVKRAASDAANRAYGTGMYRERGAPTPSNSMVDDSTSKKEAKRHKGIATAVQKMNKPCIMCNDTTDYLATLGIELSEEQIALIEASLWKPQESVSEGSFWKPERSGFSKKGFEKPKSASAMKMSRFKEYDKESHEKLKSVKMADQMDKGGK